jgi:hypothetical protein
MRWLRGLAIPALVVVLAGFASTAQAGWSGLGRAGDTAVRPPMLGAASRMDLAALLRTGTRTAPASISLGRLARPAPTLASLATTSHVFNSATSTSITSNNWSGYVVGTGPYTSVTGTFTVPGLAATPTETVTSEWVGIDGASGLGPLIQAGVDETYDPSTNLVYTSAWWEVLPAPSVPIPSLGVTAGDSVTVTIWQASGTLWGIEVADDTTGQSFTTEQSYTGPASTAEWIVEAPTDGLTNSEATLGAYSPPVTFSNLRMGGPETTLEADTMVQGGVVVSVPSELTSTGFTVSYTGSATPAPSPTSVPTPVPTPTRAPTAQVATVTLGQPFNLVLTGGSPHLPVQWQVSTDGITWAPLVTVTLDAAGNSTYTITPTQTAYYRIYIPSSGQYGSWVTEVIVQQPAPTLPAPITSISAGTALGLGTSGSSYSAATKIAKYGQYVTWQFGFGSAAAGKNVTILLATKSASGTWSAFKPFTGRIADANGNAYFHWKFTKAAWISVEAQLGTTITPARQARWM